MLTQLKKEFLTAWRLLSIITILFVTFSLLTQCCKRQIIYLDKIECALFIIDHYPENRLPVNPMIPISTNVDDELMFFVVSRNYKSRHRIIPNKSFTLDIIDGVGRKVDTTTAIISPVDLATNSQGVSSPVIFQSHLPGVYRIRASYLDKFLKTFIISSPIIVTNSNHQSH